MEDDRDEKRQEQDDDREGPAVVLPSPNTRSPMTGELTSSVSTPFVAPPPLVADTDRSTDSELADRVQRKMDQDGRFTSFLDAISLSVDNGVVQLTGPVPSEEQKQSLLAEIRKVPGVTEIRDHLAVREAGDGH